MAQENRERNELLGRRALQRKLTKLYCRLPKACDGKESFKIRRHVPFGGISSEMTCAASALCESTRKKKGGGGKE